MRPAQASNCDDTVIVFGRATNAAELAARLQNEKTRFDLPKFWSDAPVRQAVIDLYRTMTNKKAVAVMRDRFGEDRAPSASSVNRFWLRLDGLNGRKRR